MCQIPEFQQKLGKNRFNMGIFSLTEYPFRIEFERNFVELRQGSSICYPASHE